MPQHVKDFKKRATPLLKRAGVIRSDVFGSFARGDAKKNSDIDLLIAFKPGLKKNLFDLIEVKQQLEDLFGKKIDIMTYTGLHPALKSQIEHDMISILR